MGKLMMEGKDMNERATRDNLQQMEESSGKRTYQSLGEASEDRGEIPFQDIAEAILEGPKADSSSGPRKRSKSSRTNVLDHEFGLMQGIESPGGPWFRQAETSVDRAMNPDFNRLTASPLYSSRQEAERAAYGTSPIRVSGDRSPPWPGMPRSMAEAASYPDPRPRGHVQPVYESRGPYRSILGPMATNSAQHPHASFYSQYPYANGSMAPAYPSYASEQYQIQPRFFPPNQDDTTTDSTYQNTHPYHMERPNGTSEVDSTSYHHEVTSRVISNNSSNTSERKEENDSPEPRSSPRQEESSSSSPVVEPLRDPVLLHIPQDTKVLSEYQIFIRKNIEFFQADNVEVTTPAPGRKKPVTFGQVGMRCIHCRNVRASHRASATVYFPSKLKGLYQAAQNIGLNHFRKSCPNLPSALKEQAMSFQVDGKRATAGKGGKTYWADSAGYLGVVETEDGLRFSAS